MDTNINDLIEQINKITPAPKPLPIDNGPITEENVDTFVIDNATKVIEQSVAAIENISGVLDRATDPEAIEAFSELIKASAQALEVLNKIHIQNKKNKTAKEIKQMEIVAKKELSAHKLPNYGNTNVFISTRENVFKEIIKAAQVPPELEEDQSSPIINIDPELSLLEKSDVLSEPTSEEN